MEIAIEDKSRSQVSPSGQRLPPPRGYYENGWRCSNNTYEASNPDPHGALPRGPPMYNASTRGNPHSPPEMPYGRPGGIPASSSSHPETHPPPPPSYQSMNGSHEQPPPIPQQQQPQPLPKQPGHANFQPRMRFPSHGRHPKGETPALAMFSHSDPMQSIPASQPYTHGAAIPPPPGVYDTNNYFLSQGAMPLSNRQRRTTRAQQACDQCRSRKAKCDEGRPSCSHCKENNVPCVYKDVPPQKQERSTQTILERIDRQGKDTREELMTKLNEMTTLLFEVKSQMDTMTGAVPSRGLTDLTSSLSKIEESANLMAANPRPPPGVLCPNEHSFDASMHRPLHSIHRDEIRLQDTPKIENPDTDTRELSIPIEHTTAAHKLLLWPSIQKLFPERIDEDYVMHLEENRGPLRLYGQGEGDILADVPGTSPNSLEYDSSIATTCSGDIWGSGFGFPSGSEHARYSMQPHPGGLTPIGKLDLDRDVIRTYYHSYLENMHALHPFLDATALNYIIFNFIQQYSPHKPSFSSFVPQLPQTPLKQSTAFTRGKRKRPAERTFEVNADADVETTAALSPVIHKSLDNAIVLLVIALGSICSVKTDVPGPVVVGQTHPSSFYQAVIPPSPILADSGTAMGFHPSKDELYPTSAGHNQRVSGTGHGIDGQNLTDQDGPILRNMDVIPGLAYFALASDILGNVVGGGGLKHTQACLLAALYTGQLARPFSSHAWICEASRACQILLRPRTFDRIPKGTRQKDLINFAFWTCLQLESDILAELDLPASGISRFEDQLYSQDGLFLSTSERQMPDPFIMIYYVAQIHLRKVLNRVHTELYKTDKLDSPGRKASWSTKIQEALSYNLESWRTGLPDNMRWEESDSPSDNIIIARMRAKYYGARYIIHRPLLHHALHPSNFSSDAVVNTAVAFQNSSNMSTSHARISPPSIMVNPGQLSTNNPAEMYANDMGPPNRPVTLAPNQPQRVQHMPPQVSINSLDPKIRKACQACIDAAIQSTVAFDGVKGRPVVTNIFGTAHAQFGNMLVLSATYMSPLSQLVDRDTLKRLLDRTIKFLSQSRHISPSLKRDADILTLIRLKIFESTSSGGV
ncbi:hypothetical protein GX48_04805 [Paracoccidioides brasiliensis]|nr:hypothetical protein GX48_04805 [Paracoccidioides brasiliensis]